MEKYTEAFIWNLFLISVTV